MVANSLTLGSQHDLEFNSLSTRASLAESKFVATAER